MTEPISSIALSWRTRAGRQFSGGGYQTQREYLDFVIDGDSLGTTLRATARDLIGCLGWGTNSAYQDELLQQLLLARPSELETGRRLLYVCAECGDVGCDAVTAVIEEDGDCYVWKQFGLERNYELDDGPLFDLSDYEGIGPYCFDKRQYREAMTHWPARG